MKIAIEASAYRPHRTGIALYTVRLVDALLAGPARSMGDELALGYRLSRWRQRQHRYRPPGVRSFWIQEAILPPFAHYDVVHGTDGRVPNWHRAARVATVHDVGPLLFEDFSSPRFREKVRRGLGRLATQCHIIITVSESTRGDFLNLFDFPPERVQVVHLGVDDSYASHGNKDSAEVLVGILPTFTS